MTRGTFGNLEQWGPVLEQLDDWKRTGELDRHQDELLWLLRYRGNWRLREAALDVMATLQAPDPELIRQACEIIMDEDLYQEVRILAAETVAALLSNERACRADAVLLAERGPRTHACAAWIDLHTGHARRFGTRLFSHRVIVGGGLHLCGV